MNEPEIQKEEILAVYPTVAKTIADALGCDVDQVQLDVSLIDGLDAESIDFLDLVFRLERAFKLEIPRGTVNVSPAFPSCVTPFILTRISPRWMWKISSWLTCTCSNGTATNFTCKPDRAAAARRISTANPSDLPSLTSASGGKS